MPSSSPRSATVSQVRLFASRCTSAMLGNLRQHLGADLINHLLNAAGFESLQTPDERCAAPSAESCPQLKAAVWVDVSPLQIQPHVQRPILDVRQRRVLDRARIRESAAAQAQQFESLDAGGDLDDAVAIQFEARGGALRARRRECRATAVARRRTEFRRRTLARLPPADKCPETSRPESGNSLPDRSPA